MKDPNQMIRYQGFQSSADGSRQLQFSLDESKQAVSAMLTISISGKFFSQPGGITFQEATAICCAKLRHDITDGTPHSDSERIELTRDDVETFRHKPIGRRRS